VVIRVNLLPIRETRKKRALRRQLASFVLVVALALAGNFLWNQHRQRALDARQARLKKTRADIAQLERVIGEVQVIKQQQAVIKDKLAVLDKLKAGRQGPVRALDELATIIPKKVWLRRMDEKAGMASLEGYASSIDDVSLFLGALKRSQFFKDPELKRTLAKTDGPLRVVEFTLTVAVDYTPGLPVVSAALASPAASPKP
jgi:type IV pilus assembly protein PilN